MPFVLLFKGDKWAWQNDRWQERGAFPDRVQRTLGHRGGDRLWPRRAGVHCRHDRGRSSSALTNLEPFDTIEVRSGQNQPADRTEYVGNAGRGQPGGPEGR